MVSGMLGLDLVTNVLALDLVTDMLMLGLVADMLVLSFAISESEPVMTKLLHILRYADNFLFIQSPEELPTHAVQLPGVCTKIMAAEEERFV